MNPLKSEQVGLSLKNEHMVASVIFADDVSIKKGASDLPPAPHFELVGC